MDQVSHAEVSEGDVHHGKRHEDNHLDSELNTNSSIHGVPNDGTGTHSQESPSMHGKHTSHNEDGGLTSDKLGSHAKHTHHDEGAGLMREPLDKLAFDGMREHEDGHTGLAPSAHGKHTSHESDAHETHEHGANPLLHGRHALHNEEAEGMHDSSERLATREKHLPDNEPAGLVHGDSTHGKQTHAQEVQVLSGTGDRLTKDGKQYANADGTKEEHRFEEGNTLKTSKEKSPRNEPHVHGGDAAVDINEHMHKQEKHRDGALDTTVLQEHGVKCQSLDDDCESKRAFSDENSSREKVHFSRGSTPDVDTPTQHMRNPFSNPKPLKAGAKGIGGTERGSGSADGNPETPSTSWAFSARASIAPSKFDHMATLKMTYAAYKESSQGKEGVPLSLMQCC